MSTTTQLMVSGQVFPDVNHERLFLLTQPGTHVPSQGGVITQGRELRLLEATPGVFPLDLFGDRQGGQFTVLAHVASKREMALHDQLTQPTLTVERMAAFHAIQKRAFEIFESGHGASALDNWLRAERELVGLP